jgi:hypothetical protein
VQPKLEENSECGGEFAVGRLFIWPEALVGKAVARGGLTTAFLEQPAAEGGRHKFGWLFAQHETCHRRSRNATSRLSSSWTPTSFEAHQRFPLSNLPLNWNLHRALASSGGFAKTFSKANAPSSAAATLINVSAKPQRTCYKPEMTERLWEVADQPLIRDVVFLREEA